jgi:hypothetical protein
MLNILIILYTLKPYAYYSNLAERKGLLIDIIDFALI